MEGVMTNKEGERRNRRRWKRCLKVCEVSSRELRGCWRSSKVTSIPVLLCDIKLDLPRLCGFVITNDIKGKKSLY
jgi:hypothetical protein